MKHHVIVPALGSLLLVAMLLVAPAAFGLTPVAIEEAELSAGPAGTLSDDFGCAVAAQGDTIVVGAYGTGSDYGAAYVFERQADGSWARSELLPSDPGPSEFGFSVAIDGDTIVIGALAANTTHGTNAGAAYVFTRSGGVWTQQQKLVSDRGETAPSHFGLTVAVSGDTIAVGGTDSMAPAGMFVIYTRSGTTWTETSWAAHWGSLMGVSTALEPGLMLYGDSVYPAMSPNDTGDVGMMVWDGAAWQSSTPLVVPPDVGDAGAFGTSLALSGDTAAVGATGTTPGGYANAGSAYVYAGSGASWTLQGTLTASDPGPGAYFGQSVAVSGNVAAVGAPGWTAPGPVAYAGSAYLFGRENGVWSPGPQLSLPGPGGGFGQAVAMNGATLVVGAPGAAADDSPGGGLAVVYTVDDAAPVTKASLSPWPNAAGWSRQAEELTLKGIDTQSGISHVFYREGTSGLWRKYLDPIKVSAQGVSTYQAYAVDRAGHEEGAEDIVVRIDSSRPVTSASSCAGRKGAVIKLPFKVTDRAPGSLAKVTLKIYKGSRLKATVRGGVVPCNTRATHPWKCSLAKGSYSIRVLATDLAGNPQSKVGSAALKVR